MQTYEMNCVKEQPKEKSMKDVIAATSGALNEAKNTLVYIKRNLYNLETLDCEREPLEPGSIMDDLTVLNSLGCEILELAAQIANRIN